MEEFRTLKGYRSDDDRELTEAMEDYLEMVCRFSEHEGQIGINRLAALLHVRPSSASKMAAHLRDLGYVSFERYGLVTPSQKGWDTGRYLLHRHEVLHKFLCLLNHTTEELKQVEQVEHFFDATTIANLELLVARMHAQNSVSKPKMEDRSD